MQADWIEKTPAGSGGDRYCSDEARWSSLMAGAQRGNETEYRQLLMELSEVVRRYLHLRLGDIELIEDCVQESLIAVHRARHSYNPHRPFRPWLFAIVRHKTVDALRRGERRKPLRLVGDDMPELPVAGPDSDMHSGQLLAQLPPKLREALVLTKIVGLGGEEAARRLGISRAALKVRVHRAMAKLRKLLESEAL